MRTITRLMLLFLTELIAEPAENSSKINKTCTGMEVITSCLTALTQTPHNIIHLILLCSYSSHVNIIVVHMHVIKATTLTGAYNFIIVLGELPTS